MKMNPYKQFNTANLIPSETNRNPNHDAANVTMKNRLTTILKELGVGWVLASIFTPSDKHIHYLCDRNLHCSRLSVPAGTNLYTFNNADQYPCM